MSRLDELFQMDQFDPEVQYQIGLCYKDGDGVEADSQQAFNWFKCAADAGHEQAAKMLDTGIKTVLPDSIPKLALLAEEGNTDAQIELGLRWIDKPDKKRVAVRYLKEAAASGSGEASLALGHIYESIGDFVSAKKYYSDASDCRIAEAKEALARLLLKSDSIVEQREAGELLLEAADIGGPEKYFELAKLYESGDHGIERDPGKALAYIAKAEEGGMVDAQERFNEYLSFLEKEREEAVKRAEEAKLLEEEERARAAEESRKQIEIERELRAEREERIAKLNIALENTIIPIWREWDEKVRENQIQRETALKEKQLEELRLKRQLQQEAAAKRKAEADRDKRRMKGYILIVAFIVAAIVLLTVLKGIIGWGLGLVRQGIDRAEQRKIEQAERAEEKRQQAYLASLPSYDPFKDLEIEFIGISPEAELRVFNNSMDENLQGLRFVADKTNRIEEGDKIVVSVDLNGIDTVEHGYRLSATSKTYTAKGLDRMLQKSGDFKKKLLEVLKDEATSLASSTFIGYSGKIASERILGLSALWGFDLSVESAKVIKTYVLSPKNTENANPAKCVMIVEVNGYNTADDSQKSKVYFGVTTSGIVVTGQGEYDYSRQKTNITGYEFREEDVYLECVTNYKTEYFVDEL